jgi:hypothetical protein
MNGDEGRVGDSCSANSVCTTELNYHCLTPYLQHTSRTGHHIHFNKLPAASTPHKYNLSHIINTRTVVPPPTQTNLSYITQVIADPTTTIGEIPPPYD